MDWKGRWSKLVEKGIDIVKGRWSKLVEKGTDIVKVRRSKLVEKGIDIVQELVIQHVVFIIKYKENVKELKDYDKCLESRRKRVKVEVEDAENNVKGIYEEVDEWLEKVKEKKIEIDKFQNDEAHKKTEFSWDLLHLLWCRHQIGRKAKNLAANVKSLIDDSNFAGVSYPQNITSIDAAISNAGFEDFESRIDTMENIMAKLGDSTVRMIGVYGAGGVGKTTLVNAIAKKAKARKLFNRVATVDITDNPNTHKIQEDIAYVLGLRFDQGEGEIGRVDRLRRRIKQEKENTLIILDDLWSGLDLNKLGIPFDDDDDDDLSQVTVKGKKDFGYKGCKILLTSRFKEVLSDKMNVQKDSIFSVTELDEKEAVMLFKKVAEIKDENSKFKTEIVKKYCAGLPMAIVTVARALRNKSESVWEDAIQKLKKQELMGVQKSMEFSVKMSYD